MYPTLMHEIARYEQADRLREAKQARLAHEVRMASDTAAASVPAARPAQGWGARTGPSSAAKPGGLAACRGCDGALGRDRRSFG